MGESLKLLAIIRRQETHSMQRRFVDYQTQGVIRNEVKRLSKEDTQPDHSDELS